MCRFTKLPPGFSSEVANYIMKLNPEIDKLTGVPIMEFDKFCCGATSFLWLVPKNLTEEGLEFQVLMASQH